MNDRRLASGTTLHLVPEPSWNAHAGQTYYRPEAFPEEGFIHTTHGEELVIQIANMFYTADPRPYLVLEVDLDAVTAETIYEDPDDRFPHVYGPLNLDAVTGVRRVIRDANGSFVAIGDPL
ncbi:MAG: DUF952 domain-containing protein [Thermomicrobiales bacterium]